MNAAGLVFLSSFMDRGKFVCGKCVLRKAIIVDYNSMF
jgi:hypothetical protein